MSKKTESSAALRLTEAANEMASAISCWLIITDCGTGIIEPENVSDFDELTSQLMRASDDLHVLITETGHVEENE